MPRKKKYIEVYLDRRLEPLLEECLKDPRIRAQLVARDFKETPTGVVKLGVYWLLEDMGKLPSLRRPESKRRVR